MRQYPPRFGQVEDDAVQVAVDDARVDVSLAHQQVACLVPANACTLASVSWIKSARCS